MFAIFSRHPNLYPTSKKTTCGAGSEVNPGRWRLRKRSAKVQWKPTCVIGGFISWLNMTLHVWYYCMLFDVRCLIWNPYVYIYIYILYIYIYTYESSIRMITPWLSLMGAGSIRSRLSSVKLSAGFLLFCFPLFFATVKSQSFELILWHYGFG